eukprot:165875_1
MMFSVIGFIILIEFVISNGNINDFRIGVELCDGTGFDACILHTGEARYTKWFSEEVNTWGDWAELAGLDGVRIGLFGQNNNAYPLGLNIKNTDIKFCIQLKDDTINYQDNDQYNGVEECTPWASEDGGWSAYAGEIVNDAQIDALRVKIMTRSSPGLIITDLRVGIRVTDAVADDTYAGAEVYSDWLVAGQSSTWSEWIGDGNWYGPDFVKIYAEFQKSILQQCLMVDTKAFNWDTLTSDGIDIPVVDVAMSINEKDLSLNIEVE